MNLPVLEADYGLNMTVEDKAQYMECEDPVATGRRGRTRVPGLLYSVEENPPWHLSILLGLQVGVILI